MERILVGDELIDRIDVLKVSHHGSRSGTSRYFISKTLPAFAVISTSGNYGHPHEEVIDILDSFKVDTYITRDCGTIGFYFTGVLDFIKTDNNDFGIIRA